MLIMVSVAAWPRSLDLLRISKSPESRSATPSRFSSVRWREDRPPLTQSQREGSTGAAIDERAQGAVTA
jgi:hypothetical protein